LPEPRARKWLTAAGLLLLVLSPCSQATTWIEQVQSDLTCSGLAPEAERATLSAPWLPVPLNAKSVAAYFRGPPQDARQNQFRYLMILAAIAWWADLVNDQAVVSEVYVDIGVRADRAAAGGDPLYRQIARCARAHVLEAQVELDHPALVRDLAGNLASLYPQTPPGDSVEDWPLLLATRTLRIEPTGGVDPKLKALVQRYAAAAAAAGQRARAARWQAALAGGALAAGDKEAEFESLLDQSRAAETRQQFEQMAQFQQSAVQRLVHLSGLEHYSMPFYRHALDELAGRRDDDLGTVAAQDPAFASRTLATYTGLYDRLLAQSQSQFVADAREQLFFHYKIDNNLQSLALLYTAMPRSDAEIADTTFRLAQLRSYGRLTLATLYAELSRTQIDPKTRFSVERFFTLSTQTAVWMRKLFDSVRVAPDAPPPAGDALWKVFFTLDVFQEETAHQFDRYVAFVRQNAPSVAALATPRPLPVADYQRRLRTGEALVATLVTPRDLYVWAITPTTLTFVRQPVTEREVADRVQRLRESLRPRGSGSGELPPFDAADAWELYRLVFAPVENALKGVTDVVWYGHGPLGAVPPAVLVTAPPAGPRISTAEQLAATPFLVDRYSFAVLADLSLFPWHRDRDVARTPGGAFLGVGAPLLTEAEIAGGPRSRSYELAGGIDGAALAELPKLAESVDEMKGLAAAAGPERSTLWLGPEASEKRFVGDSLRRYRTIALATHGFLPNEVRDVPEPALMLVLDPDARDRFDGLLTSREIAALQLDADLVILSACNTASGDGRPRSEAFTGLAQAFFTAGARSLLVSHWPVMSGAAVELSVGTFERASRDGEPLSRSLREAMQSVRKAGAASPIESHPSYWGPFVVVGDGR
jgi:CHAT domain-containing protein